MQYEGVNGVSQRNLLLVFIKEKQPEMGAYSLKRAICRKLGVKKFADIDDGQIEAAFEFAQSEVNHLLPLWKVSRLATHATQQLLVDSGILDDGALEWRLVQKLRIYLRPEMSEKDALNAIKRATDGKNLYEIAYGKVDQS